VDARPPLLLSIDFEDWHQLVHRRLGREDWDRPHAAFVPQVHALLALLDELGARATFFFLGMTVDNYPDLAREVVGRGHDAASHGYAHARVYTQTRDEFGADVARSVEAIEGATGRRPTAYRAPAFSINRRTPWAYDALAELGFQCDSSQHDSPRVGERIGGIPDHPYRLRLDGDRELWELPIATSGSLPIGGGSYWRLLPARAIERGLRAYSVLYFHPYEFAPAALRVGGARTLTGTRLELWRNAGRGLVAKRLRRIAQTHRLVSYDQAYDDIARHYGTRTRALSQSGVLV
jgi:peptidoglycan-N-acetylglucosamine deacetylase